jgi:hypothetical protein
MKVVDFDGSVLDATFSVQPPQGGMVSVVFESSGGHEGGPNPRNLQYRQGLNVLLRRSQRLNAVIEEIRVETGRTRLLPVEAQRIVILSRSFLVALSSVEDVDVFRQEISRYGRKVGQSPALAAEGGGSSRRLRILLTGVPTGSGPRCGARPGSSGSARTSSELHQARTQAAAHGYLERLGLAEQARPVGPH